jgi:hypothetical protein
MKSHCNLANPVAARARRLDCPVLGGASGGWARFPEYPASTLELLPEAASLG